jgi:hypothetical protein
MEEKIPLHDISGNARLDMGMPATAASALD